MKTSDEISPMGNDLLSIYPLINFEWISRWCVTMHLESHLCELQCFQNANSNFLGKHYNEGCDKASDPSYVCVNGTSFLWTFLSTHIPTFNLGMRVVCGSLSTDTPYSDLEFIPSYFHHHKAWWNDEYGWATCPFQVEPHLLYFPH